MNSNTSCGGSRRFPNEAAFVFGFVLAKSQLLTPDFWLLHTRDFFLPHRFPRIKPAGKIGDVAKAGAPQNAGRNRTAITALAMDY